MTATDFPAHEVGDPPSFRLQLAAETRAHLARRRISNRQFAKMLGTTPAWVDRRLNGTTPIDSDDIDRFSGALGITPWELIVSISRYAGDRPGVANMWRSSPRTRLAVVDSPLFEDNPCGYNYCDHGGSHVPPMQSEAPSLTWTSQLAEVA